MASSDTSKPTSLSACFMGEPPIMFCRPLIMGLTSDTRPLASVERSTEARTAARTPSVILVLRVTSSRVSDL